jgi:hypothetical protein
MIKKTAHIGYRAMAWDIIMDQSIFYVSIVTKLESASNINFSV